MIDALRLAAGWALVWAFGVAIVATMMRASRGRALVGAELAWTSGCGFFVGAFVVTAWMRALSYAGVHFSVATIGLPLLVATLAMAVVVLRETRRSKRIPAHVLAGMAAPSRAERLLWIALLAWLALRFVLLLLEVVWTPLFPWDAWIQWATKARVWYALGHLVPFARADAWFAANGSMWFDAAPNYPATIPLWQVWSSIALGRWDDALMNFPWWLTAVAFALAIYGSLRGAGIGPAGALIGAWLASSLPLANVHVALAGYADLPMAAYYALAAIAIWRWTLSRSTADATLAIVLAIACPTIKTPGLVWTLTLVPGVVLATMPRRGPRIVLIGVATVLFALLVLAQTHPVVLGYRLHFEFAPAWSALFDSLFLLGNWHLLWYAVVASAIVGMRQLRTPRLVALSATIGAGLLFLAIVFAFTNARDWVTDQTTINRATLHIAPLAAFWMVITIVTWLREAQRELEATLTATPGASGAAHSLAPTTEPAA